MLRKLNDVIEDSLANLFGVRTYKDRLVKNDKIDFFTIDTTETLKQGLFETAIWLHGNVNTIVDVDHYESKEAAEAGHEKWVNACKETPNEVIRYMKLEKSRKQNFSGYLNEEV